MQLSTMFIRIVRVRETRLSALISHGLIGLSLLFVGFLQYIPVSVLQVSQLLIFVYSFNISFKFSFKATTMF